MAVVARPGRPYDAAKRKRATKQGKRGVRVYIPAEVLAELGYDPEADPVFYRLSPHRRSANAASVIVSLYREP